MTPSPYIYPGLAYIPSDLEQLLNRVAKAANLNVAELRSTSRRRHIIVAKQVFCYYARNNTRHSYSQIGECLGRYDHSTVIHCVKTVNNMINDPLIRDLLKKVEKINF